MFRTFLVLFLIVITSFLQANVLHVPGQYATIQAGIDAASSGDTVLVGPGVYVENIDYKGKAIRLRSSGGAETTYLTGTISVNEFEPVGTELYGFSVVDGSANLLIEIHASIVIEDNVFFNNYGETVLIGCYQGSVLIRHNLFHNNTVGSACVGVFSANTTIINNTFADNSRGFFSLAGSTIAKNNIVTGSDAYGVFGNFLELSYNDVFDNHPDFESAVAGPGTLSEDPLYLDPVQGRYELQPGSPCIDAGDVAAEYNDPDGTRNDMGAYAFSYQLPFASSIIVGQSDNYHVISPTPIIRWQYIGAPGSGQIKYQIEVGSDIDWSEAELWSTGEIDSPGFEAQYSGSALAPGTNCFGRLRVADVGGWGDWSEFSFHRNTPPSIPAIVDPTDDEMLPNTYVRLRIKRSFDAEADDITYSFTVAADSLFTENIVELEGQTDSLTTRLVALNNPGRYWWRSRSFDGFEYSEWSAAASFLTRSGMTVLVPNDFPTIQAAIDFAASNDTVLVGPGLHTGRIDFAGKDVVVKSEAGPGMTWLRSDVGNPVVLLTRDESRAAVLEGFGFEAIDDNEELIRVDSLASPTIRNNRFLNNSALFVLILVDSGKPLIEKNVFYNNIVGNACVGIVEDSAEIRNCTFHANSRGFFSLGSEALARNNIVTGSAGYGVYGNYSVLEFNDVWDNEPDYSDSYVSGTYVLNISLDPLYNDAAVGDLRLLPLSPCINTGDPSAIFNDIDGSRCDMGALPFYAVAPDEFGLLEPENDFAYPLTSIAPLFRWGQSFPTSPGEAVIYALVISIDSNFVFSSTQSEIVEQEFRLTAPLSWGTRYWWKVLASGSYGGERWSEEVFTFRTMTLGDADGSGQLNISDVVFLINYIFAQGPAPDPLVSGDMNCDGRINIGDAVHLVNYMFLSGPAPCDDFPTMMPVVDFMQPEAIPETAE